MAQQIQPEPSTTQTTRERIDVRVCAEKPAANCGRSALPSPAASLASSEPLPFLRSESAAHEYIATLEADRDELKQQVTELTEYWRAMKWGRR